jgi:hypothetical protein
MATIFLVVEPAINDLHYRVLGVLPSLARSNGTGGQHSIQPGDCASSP